MTSKSNYQSNHEENRSKVCAVCGKKIVFGSKSLSKFIIRQDMEKLIKQFSNDNFNLMDARFPKCICLSCRIAMNERNKGNASRLVPQMPNYIDIQLTKVTRGRDECFCYICQTGRQKGHIKNVGGRGVKKQSISITAGNGLLGTKKEIMAVKTLGKTSKLTQTATTVVMCKICFAEISKLKPHFCKKNIAHKNVLKSIENLPEKTQDYLVHDILVRKARRSNLCSKLQNVEMNLKTRGATSRVTLNPVCENPVLFSEEKLDNFVVNTGSF